MGWFILVVVVVACAIGNKEKTITLVCRCELTKKKNMHTDKKDRGREERMNTHNTKEIDDDDD